MKWGTYKFDYEKSEVISFLISNLFFWIEEYHIDGFRVDGVSSMIYINYGVSDDKKYNKYGGEEDIFAIEFLKKMNETVANNYPEVFMIAEESAAWPLVTYPTNEGGLGFHYKWDMGWMHDTLSYFARDPIYRKYHHHELTFSLLYAFNENFILSLSHDEVTHGKKSLLEKMPGDDWQKFANLRLLFGYMFAHPGKKLFFMGSEFGQRQEWQHDYSLDWHLLKFPYHDGMLKWVKDLNHIYKEEKALHEIDFDSSGFQWIESNDWSHSVLVFLRKSKNKKERMLIVCNFIPTTLNNYRIGVPEHGLWQEFLNSDVSFYGGSGQGNMGKVEAVPVPMHGYDFSINITIPPLGILFFKKQVE